ncbi:MAG: hypothetical protein CVT67_08700 [Actinobacteria bacterium HGW-Actinobacteria-7]|jgi:PAS domain S-box-containing protein|nr:MAG: hypothetical protein CVT67_08700 [Actinobacteria bacterium HGW-Actinobacteria-7]
MKRRSESDYAEWDELRARVIGLGENSAQKSYYPELVEQMAEQERFRALLDEVPDLILVVSVTDGSVADANDAAARVLGVPKGDLAGRDIHEVLPEALLRSIDPLLAGEGMRLVAESTLGTPAIAYEISARHVDFGGGHYVVVIGRDITERKRTAKLLEDHRRQLEFEVERRTAALSETVIHLREAADVRNRFLAKMSHELRTPLNSIIGFSGVMLQGHAGDMTEEAIRQLSMINDSGKHLLTLINEVLNYSRIEQGSIEVDCESFNGGDVVRRAVHMLEHEAKRRGLVLTERICDECPVIYSDPGKVTQVLTNLIENGLKYSSAGGVTVHADPDDRGGIVVKVIDTGQGIAASDIDIIWHEFRQLPRPEGALSEGIGLGLAISARLAEAIGAELTVESQVGVGSTFTFRVPNLEEGCLLPGRRPAGPEAQ